MDLRLFIALEPPEAVRRKLAAMQEVLRRHPRVPVQAVPSSGRRGRSRPGLEAARDRLEADDVKWVAPEGIHLTLQFLGAVPEENVERIEAAMEAAASDARVMFLEVKGAGGFPNARQPRVLWAGVSGDVESLAALAADLGRRLAPIGYPPEARPFSPHLTLGRAREGRGAAGIGGGLAELAAWEGIAWRASEICLVKSVLSPSGARYEVVARRPFGANPAGAS